MGDGKDASNIGIRILGSGKRQPRRFATEREAKKWSREEERRLQENPRSHVTAPKP
ncbi:MAG: hypothetical protein M1596_02810 [Firmicutes bacterium]|nr:hypothetical protein [Bacillota bacterium]